MAGRRLCGSCVSQPTIYNRESYFSVGNTADQHKLISRWSEAQKREPVKRDRCFIACHLDSLRITNPKVQGSKRQHWYHIPSKSKRPCRIRVFIATHPSSRDVPASILDAKRRSLYIVESPKKAAVKWQK